MGSHPSPASPSVSPSGSAAQVIAHRQARRWIIERIGPDQLRALHAPRPWLDAAVLSGGLALFALLAWLLASGGARDPWWWLCLAVQGNLVLVLAYINHDAFVHRKLLPRRLRWIAAALLTWPGQLRAGRYEEQHLTHHRALGTPQDTERYKLALDGPLRRILYATPAALYLRMVVFRGLTASFSMPADGDLRSRSDGRNRLDAAIWWSLLLVLLALAALNYRIVVFGYLMPLLVVTPLINSVRVALEHFDFDPEHPLWVGTFYRTGPITRLVFWWGAGDCHMVHHFFPAIPFHRMGEAVRLIRPVLIERGVVEHRSLVSVLGQWFAGNRGHGSVPPPSTQSGLK
jgi:fatty acid desaturase